MVLIEEFKEPKPIEKHGQREPAPTWVELMIHTEAGRNLAVQLKGPGMEVQSDLSEAMLVRQDSITISWDLSAPIF